MNKHDRQNLQFLLNVDQKTFLKWYAQASKDDIDYALELFARARTEFMVADMEFTDNVKDLTQAKQVLHKIMSK